jgi:hypothetical protein
MANRKSLGIIGFVLGAVTASIMVVGIMVVQAHLDGRLSLDEPQRSVASASLPTVVR